MFYIELQILCEACLRREGDAVILGAWWVDSRPNTFDSHEINERENRAVELQVIGGRFRYKMKCPKCPARPVVLGEKIDEALRAVYEVGARAKIVPIRL